MHYLCKITFESILVLFKHFRWNVYFYFIMIETIICYLRFCIFTYNNKRSSSLQLVIFDIYVVWYNGKTHKNISWFHVKFCTIIIAIESTISIIFYGFYN